MTNISKLASQSTQIFMKKGFTHAAVSFAMSTLETWVVAIWMVYTELAWVPGAHASSCFVLHTVPCEECDTIRSCSPSGICGERAWLPQVLPISFWVLHTLSLPEKFWNSWDSQTVYILLQEQILLFYTTTCTHSRQNITQRKRDISALFFFLLLLFFFFFSFL